MRMIPLAIALALVAIFALPTPALADCQPSTSESVAVPSADPARPFLLATNSLPTGIFLYQEDNGRDGLQRDDDLVNDTCHFFPADELVLFVVMR